MKLKKILAAVAAAAVAVSTMAVSTFALSGKNYVKDNGAGLNVIYIQADKDSDPSWVNDSGVAITEVYGAKFYITGKSDWYGGKVCLNSNSTGWYEINEWDNGSKPIVAVDGVVTYLADKPLFADSDEYAQIILMVYSGSDVTVNNVEILGKGGTVISTDDAAAAADDAAPADDTTAAADDKADDKAADVIDDAADADIVDVDTDDDAGDDDADDAAPAADTTADTAAADNAAPAADTTTTAAAATGNVAVASIAAVMAAAGVAAIASKKRK